MREKSNISFRQKLTRREFLKFTAGGIVLAALEEGCSTDDKSTHNNEFPTLELSLSEKQKEIASKRFESEYAIFQSRFLIHDGNDMRVLYDPDTKTSSSETNAYGMIFASVLEDKVVFDKLWSYTKKYLKKDTGLISWHTDSKGIVLDTSSAMDADQDTAFSLLIADNKWGDYQNGAQRLINAIMIHDIERGSYVVKGGDDWGGSEMTNPSYFDPHYYSVFSRYHKEWIDVTSKTQEIMNMVGEQINMGALKMFPDWVNSEGEPVHNPDGSLPRIHYDTTRIPIRQLRAAIFLKGEDSHHAIQQLIIANKFYQAEIEKNGSFEINNLKDSYSVDGIPVGIYSKTAWASSAAVASLVSENNEYRQYMFEHLLELPNDYPFNAYVKMLALLLMSNYKRKLNL